MKTYKYYQRMARKFTPGFALLVIPIGALYSALRTYTFYDAHIFDESATDAAVRSFFLAIAVGSGVLLALYWVVQAYFRWMDSKRMDQNV